MDMDEIKRHWLKNKLIIDEKSLVLVGIKGEFTLYECPLCGPEADHLAARATIAEGYSSYLSPVLNCFHRNLQWLVRSTPVADMIYNEEVIALLAKAPKIIKKVIAERGYNEDTVKFLRETYGIELTQGEFRPD